MAKARPQVRVQRWEEQDDTPAATPARPMPARPTRTAIAVMGLVLLALLPAVPTIASRDTLPLDATHFSEFGALRATAGLRLIWTSPSVSPHYVPLTYTTHWLEHRVSRAARNEPPVRLARAVNAVLHVANALLVWWVLRRLDVRAAWLGAAVFAVLPVQVETVAWISQRGVLLAATFSLLTTLLFLQWLDPPPRGTDSEPHEPRGSGATALLAAATIGCLGLALLSGLTPLALPIALAALAWWKQGSLRRPESLLLVVLATLSAAWTAVHWHRGIDGATFAADDRVAAALLPLAVPWVAVRQVLVPVGLGFAEVRVPLTASSLPLWGMAIASLLAFASLAWLVRRGRIDRGVVAAAVVFVALLAPASGWVPWPYMTLSDVAMHPSYLATVAAAALIAAGVARLVGRGRVASHAGLSPALAGASAVLLVGLAVFTLRLTPAYASQQRLLERRVTLSPDSPAALLARARLEMQASPPRLLAAEKLLRHAVEVAPDDVAARLAFAELLQLRGDPEAALNQLAVAARVAPDDARVPLQVAAIESSRGRSEVAVRLYEQVLGSPSLPASQRVQALINLGLVHQQRGEPGAAERAFLEAIERDGRSAAARINLANLLYAQATTGAEVDASLLERAAAELEKAIELDARNWVVWMNAGVMAGSLGDLPRAERLLRVSVSIAPDSPDALKNLGQVLLLRGEAEREPAIRTRLLGDAVFTLRRARGLRPDDPDTPRLLARAERGLDAGP